MATFETPPLGKYPVIPLVREGAMAHSKPFVAKPEHPGAARLSRRAGARLGEGRGETLGELVSQSRALQVFLDSCVKCGACTDKCHYYLGTADPKNMPVARQDLLRSVYRRYYTFAGKHFPWLVGARDMTQRGAGRVVQLLPPVLAVPALRGVLSLRHRHRRGLDGGARHHGQRRPGPEVLATRSSARSTRSATTWGCPSRRCATRSTAWKRT